MTYVILVAHIPDWVLEEDLRVVAVGDAFRSWWSMDEEGRDFVPSESVGRIQGQATLLPDWPGREDQHFPVRVDIGAAALYWDAPTPVEGPIDIRGVVRHNNVDAPNGFPETQGVVRRVRVEWRIFEGDGKGDWQVTSEPTRYEDVLVSSLPRLPDLALNQTVATFWTGLLIDLDVND